MSIAISKDAELDRYIKSLRAYYLGEGYTMSDSEFDELERLVLTKTNKTRGDYLEFIPDHSKLNHTIDFPEVYGKTYIKTYDDLIEKGYEFDNYISTYKFDGCSVICYYKDKESTVTMTRSSKDVGVNKTQQLKKKVPTVKSNEVIAVLCEAVVEYDGTDKSRNKANGLVNSKHMQDEVDEKLFLIPCDVVTKSELDYETRMKIAGLPIPKITDWNVITNRWALYNGIKILVDGIVFYPSKKNSIEKGLWIEKFDNSAEKKTKIQSHEWKFSEDTLRYSPVVKIKEVDLDGTLVSSVKVGPYSKMKELGCGIGAEILMKKSGSTTPALSKVIKPSYVINIPKCECGSDLEEYGTNLICSNRKCRVALGRILYVLLLWFYDEDDALMHLFCSEGYQKKTFLSMLNKKGKTVGDVYEGKVSENDLSFLLHIPGVSYDSDKKIGRVTFESIERYLKNLTDYQQGHARYFINTLVEVMNWEIKV